MNEPAAGKTMTVREVADVLGYDVSTITKKVRELFPDLMENGKTTCLTETQVTAVKLHLGKNSEVAALPKTRLEKALLIQQAMRFQDELIAELEMENAGLKAKIKADRPKVEIFDRAMSSGDTLDMRRIAAVLNVKNLGRNKLFDLLRRKGILDGRNVPYREYQDRGFFRVAESVWTDSYGSDHVALTTYVYQKGLAFIADIVDREIAIDKKIVSFTAEAAT